MQQVFSLFTGIGGFDLGLQREDFTIIGACEIDRYARQIYQKHFPGVPVWQDATKIRPEELPDFEMLCAGFPCQAFSIAGKRLGFEESRGTLFFEIVRIARQKRPKLLFLENVKGLLSHANGKTFANILATLDELGYDVEWQVFNSKYFVPQNRERIFIIGHLRDKPTPKIFPIKEDGGISLEEQEPTNVRTITGGGHSGGLHSQMTILTVIQSESQANRVYNTVGICPTLGVGHAMNSPNIIIPVLTPDRPEKRQNGRRFKTDGEPSFTLTAQDKHGVYDGKKIRRLTPLECERLQGFPDGWTEGVSDTQRYKQLGNAVTVPVVQYIASCLTKVVER